jgi:hypothetical protein
MKQPPVKAPRRSKDPLPAESKGALARRRATGEIGAKVGTLLPRKRVSGVTGMAEPGKDDYNIKNNSIKKNSVSKEPPL